MRQLGADTSGSRRKGRGPDSGRRIPLHSKCLRDFIEALQSAGQRYPTEAGRLFPPSDNPPSRSGACTVCRSPAPHREARVWVGRCVRSGTALYAVSGRRVAFSTADCSCMARSPICRQSPEVGAGCLDWARPDLCGALGQPAFLRRSGLHGRNASANRAADRPVEPGALQEAPGRSRR